PQNVFIVQIVTRKQRYRGFDDGLVIAAALLAPSGIQAPQMVGREITFKLGGEMGYQGHSQLEGSPGAQEQPDRCFLGHRLSPGWDTGDSPRQPSGGRRNGEL